MSEIQHLTRILEICKEGNNEQFHEIALTASLMAMEMVTRIAELEAAAPRPLTVIAPPLEWEGINYRGSNRFNFSKCKEYHIDCKNGRFVAYKWGKEEALHDGESEQEAIAACQAHAQEIVNAANIRFYRDPQGLVDGIKKQFADFDTARSEGLDALSALAVLSGSIKGILKAWEEGK